MAQKVLKEEEMRKYIENEVRNALMNEMKASEDGKELNESLFSWESLIGAGLGRYILAPIIKKLLTNLGVDPDGPLGKLITTASMAIGAAGGSWVDKNHNLLGN